MNTQEKNRIAARERMRKLNQDPEYRKKKAEKEKERRAKMDPEKKKEMEKKRWHQRKDTQTIKYKTDPKARMSMYKYNAKRSNRSFELTLEQCIKFFESDCFYCGEPKSTERLTGIDRKDNDVGYTERNCVACCITCNLMKKDFECDLFIAQCIKIANHNK